MKNNNKKSYCSYNNKDKCKLEIKDKEHELRAFIKFDEFIL